MAPADPRYDVTRPRVRLRKREIRWHAKREEDYEALVGAQEAQLAGIGAGQLANDQEHALCLRADLRGARRRPLGRLGERLAAIDLLSVSSIRELRESIAAEIERYLHEAPGSVRDCPPGDEFHFCEAKSFVFPTGLVAHDVSEFFSLIPSISNASLHFHFFEARLRLERPTNDFTFWLSHIGEDRLARAIDRLNPYVVSLEELKAQIFKIGRRYIRKTA